MSDAEDLVSSAFLYILHSVGSKKLHDLENKEYDACPQRDGWEDTIEREFTALCRLCACAHVREALSPDVPGVRRDSAADKQARR